MEGKQVEGVSDLIFEPETVQVLSEKLNPDVVTHREERGRKLDYLEGFYVIERLNEIFGYGGWSFSVTNKPEIVTVAETNRETGSITQRAMYFATVRLQVATPAGSIEREDVGACSVSVYEKTDAHDTAIKGAVTDALKRAARTLGDQFGLSLYDKDDPIHVQSGGNAERSQVKVYNQTRTTEQDRKPSDDAPQLCPSCSGSMTLRSGTAKTGQPYTAWFCNSKCGQKPLWVNEKKYAPPPPPPRNEEDDLPF